MVKTFTKNKVVNGLWIIAAFVDLFQKLSRKLPLQLVEATTTDRNGLERNSKRARVLGGKQMLMTKEVADRNATQR